MNNQKRTLVDIRAELYTALGQPDRYEQIWLLEELINKLIKEHASG